MQLFCTITAKSGQRVPLSLENTDLTPTQLRQTVSDATKIPLKDLRLIFRGRMIKDDDSISSVTTEYKLEEGSVLHCMGKPVEDSSNSTTESASAAATTPDTTTVPNRTVVPPLSTATTTPVVAAPSAAAASSTSASFASNRGHNPLSNALMRLKQNNPLSVYATAVGTLDKVLTNIVNNPMEEKYRKVKKNNAAFGKRLGKLVGGHDCMLGAGFVVEHQNGEEIYQFHASATKWGALLETKKTVSGAAKQAKEEQEQAKQRPSAGFGTSAVPVPSSNPGMGGGFAPPNMNDPNMQNMMSQMMNNPEALGQALQVRYVQSTMSFDDGSILKIKRLVSVEYKNKYVLDTYYNTHHPN